MRWLASWLAGCFHRMVGSVAFNLLIVTLSACFSRTPTDRLAELETMEGQSERRFFSLPRPLRLASFYISMMAVNHHHSYD